MLVIDSLEPTVELATIAGVQYQLREADEGTGKLYRQMSLVGVELQVAEDTGDRVIKQLQGIAAVQAFLVSRCLFENIGPAKEGDPDRWRAVSLERVNSWPTKAVRKLHDRIKEMSELDEPEDLEGLKRQRAKLDARIKVLEAQLPKDGQPSTTGTSA